MAAAQWPPFLRVPPASDEELRAPPAAPLSPAEMFVCTYAAVLRGLPRSTPRDLIGGLELGGGVVQLDCNFGHKAAPGRAPKKGRPPPAGRRVEGDASCFNSALQAVLVLEGQEQDEEQRRITAEVRAFQARRGQDKQKQYCVKFFPATGLLQVTGVVLPGLEDGAMAVRFWRAFLARQGWAATGVDDERPIMRNYMFVLLRPSPRVVLNLERLAELVRVPVADGGPQVCTVAPPGNTPKVGIRYQVGARTVLLNVFPSGKFNVLGADGPETAAAIRSSVLRLLQDRWRDLVQVCPLPDQEAAALARARQLSVPALLSRIAALVPPPGPRPPPAPQLSDEALEALLRGGPWPRVPPAPEPGTGPLLQIVRRQPRPMSDSRP